MNRVPPSFFMTADTPINLNLITPKLQSLTPYQVQTLTNIGSRLVSLETTNEVFNMNLNLKLDKLTKLHMNFHLQNTGGKAEEDWSGFVALVNNSPNITDLSITDLSVSKEVIARNPKIILDKVKSLHVVLKG